MISMRKTILCAALAGALTAAAALPARALWSREQTESAVAAFAKSDSPGQIITFTPEDFRVSGQEELSAIVVRDLPAGGALRLAGADVNKEGTTIVMVTHSQKDAACAQRIVNLFDGQIVSDVKNEL